MKIRIGPLKKKKKWRTVDVCVFAYSGVWTILLYFLYKTGSVRRGTNLCVVYSHIIQGFIVLLCKMCRVANF